MHAGYPVIWLPTPNLWRYLRSIVSITMLVPSLCLLSPLSVSLHPSSPSLSFFSPAYVSICPITGLGEKGLHEQALCHSGRVHQRAECSGWSGLLWREDKEVSHKPALRHPACFTLLRTFYCVFSPLPSCLASPECKLGLLSGSTSSVTPNPVRRRHRLLLYVCLPLSLQPAWPLNKITHWFHPKQWGGPGFLFG